MNGEEYIDFRFKGKNYLEYLIYTQDIWNNIKAVERWYKFFFIISNQIIFDVLMIIQFIEWTAMLRIINEQYHKSVIDMVSVMFAPEPEVPEERPNNRSIGGSLYRKLTKAATMLSKKSGDSSDNGQVKAETISP